VKLVVEALVAVREEIVVVAKVDVPTTLKIPDAERLVVEALASVVCPVTLSEVSVAVPRRAP
jgi:ethanolamine utilization protein EutP (predicted NTPase)